MRFITFLLCLPLAGAEPWTIDDILFAERAGEVNVSRDGSLVVFAKSKMDRDKGENVSNLLLRNLAEDYEIELTRGPNSNFSPKFSPDGRRIAFLSDRQADQPQLWLIDARGGEPWRPARLARGVRAFDWIDNDRLLLAAPEDPDLLQLTYKERKDDSIAVEDQKATAPVRLFRLEVKGGKLTRLTENTDRIEKLAVSPDGRYAVTVNSWSLRYRYDQKIPPATFLHDLAATSSMRLFAGQRLVPIQIAWSPDSRGFYFSASHSSHPIYTWGRVDLLYYCDLASRQAARVDLQWDRGLGFGFVPVEGGFLALLANGVRPRPAYYRRSENGWTRAWIESPHAGNIFALAASPDGRTVVYEHSTSSSPPQWYNASLQGVAFAGARPLTEAGGNLKAKQLTKSEVVHWKGARDETVEGILYYPLDYESGRRYPLVAIIHGGPNYLDADRFSDGPLQPSHLLAQRGAFVLKANYHGSLHYGLAWAESIAGGNYNELETVDVERGVDALIARGLADPGRLAVWGWSNGAIIAIELTTRTTRYQAAVTGAGDVNWITDWSNCEYGHAFGEYFLGKTPLEDIQLHLRKSALFRLDRVRTPTLIMFGAEDRSVPTEQGWQHFRALQHWGNTDVRFVLFPGEGHSPTKKLAHRRRVIEEQLAWLDKYLFKTAAEANSALKPESPLAAALKRAGGVPETVRRGAIEIGRFEVTRAQYAAFDSSYKFSPGTEHFPANNISFEKALKYCAWLSRRTGRKVRLGTEEEIGSLLTAAAEENTLDRWAGYAVNADDFKRLAPLIDSLGPDALLRPVGSFAGIGDEPAFDLRGNVAEWVIGKDGKGKPLGGCAALPADPKSSAAPKPEYIGFRVVIDP